MPRFAPWRLMSASVLPCAIALMALAPPVFADPIAIIAAIQGRVEVVPARAKTPIRAAFGRPLERGDKVVVGAGGAATVFFNDGNVVELAEKSSITVGGKVGSTRSAGLPGEVYANVSRFATAGSRQTGLVAMAGMRSGADDGTPLILAPRRTSVLTDAPEFAWRPVAGATRYRVRLSSSESGELWVREIAASQAGESPRLAYPDDAPKPGGSTDLLWEVEALDELKTLRRESTTLHVASAGQRDDVRANLDRIRDSAGGPDAPAARFLSGSYLSGLGFHHEALEHFRALASLTPDSPTPHEALGNLYSSIGLMDMAAAEYQQALMLARDTR